MEHKRKWTLPHHSGPRSSPSWMGHGYGSLDGEWIPLAPHQWNFLEICPLEFWGKLFIKTCLTEDILLQNHLRGVQEEVACC